MSQSTLQSAQNWRQGCRCVGDNERSDDGCHKRWTAEQSCNRGTLVGICPSDGFQHSPGKAVLIISNQIIINMNRILVLVCLLSGSCGTSQ